jgi:hypothetical protein
VPDRDPDQDQAERDLDRERGQRGHRGRLGRVVAGGRHGDGDHDGQGYQPPEHEGRAFDRAVLGGQHDEERCQLQRVERDRQADQHQVED